MGKDIENGQQQDEPLVWTTKGNLAASLLTYQTLWDVNDEQIIFREVYRLEGEIVKDSVHVKKLKGLELGPEQSIF